MANLQCHAIPVTNHWGKIRRRISTSTKMLRACNTLQVPVYVTTQNRARLGETVSELHPYLSGPHIRADIDKTLFSMITPEMQAKIAERAPAGMSVGSDGPAGASLDAVIIGIEAHVCVTQTALDLMDLGHRVYILADGVSSVNAEERAIALARLRDVGAIVTTSESMLFEILGDATKDGFKAMSNLVKETKEETKAALGAFCKI
jgi:Isochorismatase family